MSPCLSSAVPASFRQAAAAQASCSCRCRSRAGLSFWPRPRPSRAPGSWLQFTGQYRHCRHGGRRGAGQVMAALKEGGPADVVLLPSADFADLPWSPAPPLGRIAVGVAVKAGSPGRTFPRRRNSSPRCWRPKASPMPILPPAHRRARSSTACCRLPEFAGVKRVPVKGLAVTAWPAVRPISLCRCCPSLRPTRMWRWLGRCPTLMARRSIFRLPLPPPQGCREGRSLDRLPHSAPSGSNLAGQWLAICHALRTELLRCTFLQQTGARSFVCS